jgi:hypothetical protein
MSLCLTCFRYCEASTTTALSEAVQSETESREYPRIARWPLETSANAHRAMNVS